MNSRYSILKKTVTVWLLLFTVATSVNLYAQEQESDELDLILDDLFFNDQQFIDDLLDSFNTYNFLYTNISFNSNTYFSGRDSGVNQFNLVPQLSYYSSFGLYASISGLYYETFDPNWDFTNVSVGYYNTLDKKELINYNIGYTRYFYSDGWDTFTNSIDLSIGIRNKTKTLGTKLASSYLFGKEQSLQLVSRSFVSLTLAKHKNYIVKFRPQLSFIIAQQTIALAQLDNAETSSIIEYEYDAIFDLLNTQINLPISLATKSWDFELGYTINFPSAVGTETDLKTTGFLNLSIGYLIDLDKK